MNNNNAELSFDIVGYAAKTEELKAELLSGVAAVFRDTAMGSRTIPREDVFARMLSLMIMLANRCGTDHAALARELRAQAKAGLVRDDAFARDYLAVLHFIENKQT